MSPTEQFYGVDLSHHQNPNNLDYFEMVEHLKGLSHDPNAQVVFLLRLGERDNVDSWIWLHHKLAREAGALVQPYWYIDGRMAGYYQGEKFGRTVNDFEWDAVDYGNGPIKLAFFDIEENNNPVYGDLTPTYGQVVDSVAGFYEHSTLDTAVYTGRSAWKSIMRSVNPNTIGITTDILWLADWNNDEGVKYIPEPFNFVNIEQELSRAIPGSGGAKIDFNIFHPRSNLTIPEKPVTNWRDEYKKAALGFESDATDLRKEIEELARSVDGFYERALAMLKKLEENDV